MAAGCASVVRVTESPFRQLAEMVEAEAGARNIAPAALQNQLMRFADSYHSAVIGATAQLRENGQAPDPIRLLSMKLRYSEDLYAVATGPNPLANLLDMVVVVTMTRMQLQDYWMPEVFGASAETLMAILLQQERTIWTVASAALTPAEQNELRKALRAWHAKNRELKTLDEMRATGFATAIARYSRAEPSTSGSVFDLLDLDPLSSLDPATQEMARTRQFAERALFLVQRMPTLLRWQSELLAMSVARLPEVQTALGDTTRLTAATDRLSRVAEQLPADIARERQLVLDALQLQSGTLSTLAGRFGQALQAGTDMAQSTDATLRTFDRVYHQLQSAPGQPDAKPFRIEDYKDVATQVAVAAAQINETVKSLDAFSGSADSTAVRQYWSHLAEQLERRGDRLIDRLIRAGAVLIGLACAGLLAVLLVYRWVMHRWYAHRL